MKTVLCLIVAAVLGLAGPARAQSPDDFLKAAAENNPGLRAKYAAFEAALQRVTQARALPDPTLSFGYFIRPVETRVGPQQARISLSQMFPWFGSLAAKKEAYALEAEARYQEFLDARNELYYAVRAAWYPLYEVHRTLVLQQRNRDLLAGFRELALSAFRNGKAGMADVIRVDIMLDRADTEIRLLEDRKKPLQTRFRLLLNGDTGQAVPVPDSLAVDETFPALPADSLFAGHPALKAFDARARSATARETAARKSGLPRFGVGMDYVFVGKRTDMDVPGNGKDVLMPMVSVSLPLFRGNYKAAVKEAQFTRESIAAARQAYANELTGTYEMTLFELGRAGQMAALYRDQIEKTRQVVSLLLSEYANSGRDFDEVLRKQQDILQYQIAEATAVRDYHTARARLDYLTAKSVQP